MNSFDGLIVNSNEHNDNQVLKSLKTALEALENVQVSNSTAYVQARGLLYYACSAVYGNSVYEMLHDDAHNLRESTNKSFSGDCTRLFLIEELKRLIQQVQLVDEDGMP